MIVRKNEATWSEKRSRWEISEQRDGRRKYFYSKVPGRKGKLAAERQADEWLAAGSMKDSVRLGELAKMYLASLDTGNGTGHLRRETSTVKTWLLPYYEHRKTASMTQLDYQEAVRRPVLQDPPRSARTCGHVRSTLCALASFAARAKIVMEPPQGIKIPKAAAKGVRRVLQPEDLRRLFDPAHDSYYHVHAFRVLVLLGLRRGELCGLRREDYDGQLLTVRRNVNNIQEITEGKTDAALRSITLPTLARRELDAQLAMLEQKGISSEYLFPSQKGTIQNTNAFYNRWCYFREHIGLPDVSLHELRHTMVSATKADVPLPLLKAILGHVPSMDTLGVYGHAMNGDGQRTANIMDEVYTALLT